MCWFEIIIKVVPIVISVIALIFSVRKTKYEKEKDQDKLDQMANNFISENRLKKYDDKLQTMAQFYDWFGNNKVPQKFERLSPMEQRAVNRKLGINYKQKHKWLIKFRNRRIMQRNKKLLKKEK